METYEEILEEVRVQTSHMDVPQVQEQMKIYNFKWENSQLIFNRRLEELKSLGIDPPYDDPETEKILDRQLHIIHKKLALLEILVFKMESLV